MGHTLETQPNRVVLAQRARDRCDRFAVDASAADNAHRADPVAQSKYLQAHPDKDAQEPTRCHAPIRKPVTAFVAQWPKFPDSKAQADRCKIRLQKNRVASRPPPRSAHPRMRAALQRHARCHALAHSDPPCVYRSQPPRPAANTAHANARAHPPAPHHLPPEYDAHDRAQASAACRPSWSDNPPNARTQGVPQRTKSAPAARSNHVQNPITTVAP